MDPYYFYFPNTELLGGYDGYDDECPDCGEFLDDCICEYLDEEYHDWWGRDAGYSW